MFGSEVLDVAIGLVFVYLVLSLICSAACELIESMLKRRAAYLERGLRELLSDADGERLVREVYNHPLISSLFTGNYQPDRKSNLPSYIPPENFSLALMNIVGLYGVQSSGSSQAQSIVSPPVGIVSPEWVRSTIRLSSQASPHLTQALLVIADSSGYDLSKIRASIEGWYNSSMDRVSGWFKRRSHVVILILGFTVSVVINADTISITNSLATNKSLREALVSAASDSSKALVTPVPTDFDSRLRQIRNAGLPLGWTTEPNDSRRVPRIPQEWFIKIFGLALTALAISLGGPFWFDTLNRFIVVRSTVKPSEKSADEPSKS